MIPAEVRFHPAAAFEYGEVYTWYITRSTAIGRRFEEEVERCLEAIAEAPGRWPVYDATHRKLLTRRFPYLLIFRVYEEQIWVVAVAHAHRKPGYWKTRKLPGEA